MRLVLSVCLGIGMGVGLAACGLETAAPAAQQQSYWQETGDKDLLHSPSGVNFPQEAGEYRRGRMTEFTNDGSDVAATYDIIGDYVGKVRPEVTLYVTYGPAFNDGDYMAIAATALTGRFPAAVPLANGPFAGLVASMPDGLMQTYLLSLPDGDYITGIWVAKKGDWLLKARFTFSTTMPGMEGFDLKSQAMPAQAAAVLAAVGW